MKTHRVIQTVKCFHYPTGTVWGPYKKETDAVDRVLALQEKGGNGEIESGEFGPPCKVKKPNGRGGVG